MELIIGLIGAKAAGKTTAYKVMAEVEDVAEITLAGKLKDVCAEVTAVAREAFDSPKLKEKSFEVPLFVDGELLGNIFKAYSLSPDYDKFIRPYIGKILHTPREIAQYIGTEVLRNIEKDIHCKASVENISGKIGAVTDIRFPSELTFFKKNYSTFVPIYIKNSAAEIVAEGDAHVSEAHLRELAIQALYTVPNDRTLSIFKDRVLNTLKTIIGGINV